MISKRHTSSQRWRIFKKTWCKKFFKTPTRKCTHRNRKFTDGIWKFEARNGKFVVHRPKQKFNYICSNGLAWATEAQLDFYSIHSVLEPLLFFSRTILAFMCIFFCLWKVKPMTWNSFIFMPIIQTKKQWVVHYFPFSKHRHRPGSSFFISQLRWIIFHSPLFECNGSPFWCLLWEWDDRGEKEGWRVKRGGKC